MSTPSNASGGRFRQADVVPSTPEQELEQLLDDGQRMYARYEELLREAGEAGDAQLVARLARVARGATDPHRAYAAQRLAANLLQAMSQAAPKADLTRQVLPHELALQLLVEQLEETPHEPELLYLLGVTLHSLWDDRAAERVLDAVVELEPDHAAAIELRRHVRHVRGRSQPDISRLAPSLDGTRAAIRSIVDRSVQLSARTISLCMIVRDEEEMLPATLSAVAPFVDQMVVVDTGSTDRTREIAREAGAEVHEFEWTGSFSDARNESLRHATGDWILWLDADEQLVAEDGPQLRELARRTWVEGYHVLETHFLGSGNDGTATHTPMRMFRRRPEYEWRGTIHEQVAWALPTWLPGRVQHTNVRVDHFGYMADVVADRDKRRRNLELLLAQHEREPSAFTSFNIGSEHAASGEWNDAHLWFERALGELRGESEHWHRQPWAPLLVQRATTARRMCGDPAATIELADEGLALWPDYTDLRYEQARASADMGAWDAAAGHALAAIEQGDAPSRYVAVSGKGSFQARHVLAQALRARDDLDGAREQLTAALEQAPHYHAALGDLVDVLVAQGLTGDALDAAIDEVLGDRTDSPAANLLVATRLHEVGDSDRADARYERVLAARPTHASALIGRAELALTRREFELAWELGMRLDPLDRLAGHGAQSAFLAAAAAERVDLLAEPADRIEASQALAATERAIYVAWRQQLDPGDGIRALVPSDALARDVLLRNLEGLARVHATDAFEQLYGLAAGVIPDDYERRLAFAELYLRLSFADMAGEELMLLAQEHGPDARILTGLGKVATIKHMWDDAEVFLDESLQLDPNQQDARRLLGAVREQRHG